MPSNLLFSSSTYADVVKNVLWAESVIKPCLKMVAYMMHGGKHAVDKVVEKIPLSDDTTNIQCAMIIVTSAIYIHNRVQFFFKENVRYPVWTRRDRFL